MKIAWFTPFNKKSGISRYSQVVTNELVKHCEVDLWVSDGTDLLPTELKVFRYSTGKDISTKRKDYDYVIYNMGAHLGFHKAIYETSRLNRGVVILHDFVMHHFFAGYYLDYMRDKSAYLDAVAKLYGQTGREIAEGSLSGNCRQVWETENVVDYPFFEKAVEGATGVIVHSAFLAAKVRACFLGPVETIYLPFNPALIAHSGISKADLGLPEDKLLVVSSGYINPNKRIDKVIEVLAEDKDLADRVTYVIIGSSDFVQYYSHLEDMVTKMNLQNTVRFMGFQPDDILGAYMLNADIFINLRFPAMEGASWSLITELHHEKPVIVIDNGFYSEIPDGCLVKIDANNEKMGLHDALMTLTADNKMRAQIGEKGKQFALTNFTTEKYYQKFTSFLDQVQSDQPVLQLVDRVGQELALMKAKDNMAVVNKVAQSISVMFGQQ